MAEGLSRRDMIKGAAVAGAAAWSAPMIIDSLTSTAGAATVEQCGVVKIASNSGISGGGFSQCDMAGNLDITCLVRKVDLLATNYSPSVGIAVVLSSTIADAINFGDSSIGSNVAGNCNVNYNIASGDQSYSTGGGVTCIRSFGPLNTATASDNAGMQAGSSSRIAYATLPGGGAQCAAAGTQGFVFTIFPKAVGTVNIDLGGGTTIKVCNGQRLIVFDFTANVNQVALQVCFAIGSVPPLCSGSPTFPTC